MKICRIFIMNSSVVLLLFFCCAGFRFAPVISTVDEEVESQHLRFLAVPPGTCCLVCEQKKYPKLTQYHSIPLILDQLLPRK